MIYICHGLPASGKTLWAEKLSRTDKNVSVINRDEIREQLYGICYTLYGHLYGFCQRREDTVTRIQYGLISETLKNGKTAVSSDSNISPKYLKSLMEYLHECDEDTEIRHVYFPCTIETALKRNSARSKQTSPEIIRKMEWDLNICLSEGLFSEQDTAFEVFREKEELRNVINVPDAKEILMTMRVKFPKCRLWYVGGAVRDGIKRLFTRTERKNYVINDVDLASDLTPEEISQCFGNSKFVGNSFGVSLVRINGKDYEVASLRSDGSYSDGRRPDSFKFLNSIKADLARRDFTMNAAAADVSDGIITDPFNGAEDIEFGVIRAVGTAKSRIEEDFLRILRAVRFASVLGYKIDEELKYAMYNARYSLVKLPGERIRQELIKASEGKYFADVLSDYKEIFWAVIPELKPMYMYDQNNPWHHEDLWTHTLSVIRNVFDQYSGTPPYQTVLAALFHDIGKPDVGIMEQNPSGKGKIRRYWNHQLAGKEIALQILRRLCFTSAEIRHISTLVEHHDIECALNRSWIRKALSRHKLLFTDILRLRAADAKCHAPDRADEKKQLAEECLKIAENIIKSGDCISLSQLAVNGNDLSETVRDKTQTSAVLNRLLDRVMDDSVPNEKYALIKEAEEYIKSDEFFHRLKI